MFCKIKGKNVYLDNRNTVAKDNLKHENYKNVLFNATCLNHEMNRIQSKSHNIGSYRINKVALFCYDDKKYILEKQRKINKDGYHTLSRFQNINLLVNHIEIISSSMDSLF